MGLVLAGQAHALDPAKAITQYLQTNWNTATGLPQSTVIAVEQTTDGYMWLGTEEGLTRFDGVRFTVFTRRNTPGLASNYIQALRADPDGSLWIGTDTGLSHFRANPEERQSGTFDMLTTADGLSSNNITALCEDHEGGLWIGTSDGLNRLRHGHIQQWSVKDGLAGMGVNAMAVDSGGTLWVGTEKGLSRFEKGHFVTLSKHSGLPSDIVTALAASPDGSIYVGTLSNQVAQILRGHLTILEPRLPWNEINALLPDRNGSLWMAFDHHGIGRLQKGRLDLYDAARGLPSDRCSNVLFEDREGSLWLGLQDAGVVQLRDGKFSVFGQPEGLSGNYIDSVMQAQDGTMWIAADTDGLNHLLADGKVELWNQSRGLPNQEIFSILQTRDGSLWVGYRRGTLARMRNGRIWIYHDNQAADVGLLSLFEDRQGQLWVGFAGSGLALFDNGHFHHVTSTGQVRSIIQSTDGALWIGLDGDGVERFDGGSITRRFTSADGLAGNHVLGLDGDRDGTIWVGTADGLSRIRDGHIISWTPQQGLPDSAVGSVIEDNLGNLWIGGDSGILRIAKQELNQSALAPGSAIHPVVYGTSDGLRTRETLYGTGQPVWKSRDGRLWFSTIMGAAVIDPAHIAANQIVPPVWIERVTFNSQNVLLRDGLHLGPGSGNLEVTFTAPSFVAPQQVRFRYRLRGFDPDWVYTSSRVAWYTNLPSGHYDFAVEAANSDDVWNRAGASFHFVLRPLAIHTPLAWFCYAILASLLAWSIVDLRTRNLRKRQKELTQTVAERTAQLEEEKAALEAARHELHIQATHDSLTGLFNRAAILEHLQREISRAKRDRMTLTVVIADLDHFKDLNDSYGHLCGDDTIREAAERFRAVMRNYDLAGRYGGEEFLMLLPGLDPRMAPARLNELLEAIRSRPFHVGETEVELTCSIGVAIFRPDLEMPTVRDLLSRADTALYTAKRGGRNQVVFEPVPLDEEASCR